MMLLGYARVSTIEQDTAAQVSALKSAGCEKIFRDKASGGRWDRPELHRLLDQHSPLWVITRRFPSGLIEEVPLPFLGRVCIIRTGHSTALLLKKQSRFRHLSVEATLFP